ncbi:PKD domain-containing protein [Lewinella sp. W8]|uniref:PKD domain-containing protein n=1 Tax=Lewinella sp. W8 TaxID=2528208 RepID=UPI001563C885|nr:PKD domain-containing protein [Lewinella sp. W8]
MQQHYSRLFPGLVVLFFLPALISAQNIRISQGGQENACSGTFFDTGGPNGNTVGNGQFQEITLCADGSGATHMQLFFTELNIDGEMIIYNGQDATAPEITRINGSSNGQSFFVEAKLPNTSGCLFIRYNSTGIAPGWAANINCVPACQPIEAILDSAIPAPVPAVDGYIDICPGEPITLTGRGIYDANNSVYAQSDATSIFTWNMQDGTILTGQTITHTYEEPGGYVVQLTIEDVQGCTNSNRISQRIRVSPPPNFNLTPDFPTEICSDEAVSLTVKTTGNGSTGVVTEPQELSFNTSQTLTELTLLPDGDGAEYSSPLTFSNFRPGQTLERGSDIVRICARMEHSYLGDLDMWIECPDGSRLDLHRYDGNDNVDRQLLGQGRENTTTPDPPETYCWTATAPRTMAEHVTFFNVGDNQSMPGIDYAAEESFNTLIGCPLNGEWTLNIRDNIPRDNGSIYEWTIEFENSVYPDQETFTVPVSTVSFVPNSAYPFYSTDSIVVQQSNPGNVPIRIGSEDDFGCTYDTTIFLSVLPPMAPQCVNCTALVDRPRLDTAICEGSSFEPNVASLRSDTMITWEVTAEDEFSNALYESLLSPYTNTIMVDYHNPAVISDASTDIVSVCVDLENNGDLRDISLQLVGPNGRSLTLMEGDGGPGESLTSTCFSPTATNPISSGTAPYTGTFRSQGSGWTGFNTAPINGAWTLRAWDRLGNDVGEFIKWSITFRHDPGYTYSWTPANGDLSCTDCPNPTITPSAAGTYTLTVSTLDGCTDQASVEVTFNSLQATVADDLTNPDCNGNSTGAIDLTVTGPAASYTYRWSTGAVTEDISGLSAGPYSVEVINADGCSETFNYTLTDPPALTVRLDSVRDVSCFGGSNGEIFVTTAGGTGPYTYLWDDPNAQIDEDAGALTVGTYRLVVTDANMCTATLTAMVAEPTPLGNSFRTTDVACFNGSDGRIVALPTGGNGGYQFNWSNGGTQDSIVDVPAGTYELTITDRRGCQTTDMVTITEPATAITATITQDQQGCFGASANVATVMASGGAGSFTYEWNSGETAATAVALPNGTATVSVTDTRGCTQVFTETVNDLPEVTVNILATQPTCSNRDDGQLGVVPGGGAGQQDSDYSFNWSTGATGIVITNLPGNVNYGVTVTDPRGCQGTGERFLPAPPPITFTATEDPVDCFGNSTGGLSLSNIDGPNPGTFMIQWGANAGFSQANTISNLPAGNYGLQITDVDNCRLDTTLVITQPNRLQADINRLDVSCFGEADGRISALGTGGVGGYQYLWSTGSTDNQITGLVAGSYDLQLTDANNCVNDTTIVIAEPTPVGIATSAQAALCAGEATGTISIMGSGGRPPFVYGLENRGFTRSPDFLGLPAGEYIAFVRDSAGCQISENVIVNDGPFFSLDLGQDTTIIFGDSLQLQPSIVGGIGMLEYRWRGAFDGTLDCTDCPAPTAKPEFEIDYTLSLTDDNGCEAEDRVRVSVRKIREVAVPTAFSPNGDSRNDRLLVHGRPGTQVIDMMILDRWGNVLFHDGQWEVNDPNRGWDGTHEGKVLNAGVYLFKVVIEYEDRSQETIAGETTLIR